MQKQNQERMKYWFPAKKFGWGWGLPSVWQGWVTIIFYLGSIPLIIYFFPPEENFVLFIFSTSVLTALLIVVCWVKGEPPKWRWGKQ